MRHGKGVRGKAGAQGGCSEAHGGPGGTAQWRKGSKGRDLGCHTEEVAWGGEEAAWQGAMALLLDGRRCLKKGE